MAELETVINRDEICFAGGPSDPVGRVFFWQGRVFRGIYPARVPDLRKLLQCGLTRELEEKGLLVATSIAPFSVEGFGMVLEHERIDPVLRPATWVFDMIKDAALAVLAINEISLSYGYQLADSCSQNLAFDRTSPKLFDIGALYEVRRNQSAWAGYELFMQTYYYPLVLARDAACLARLRQDSENYIRIPHHLYYIRKLPPLKVLPRGVIDLFVHAVYRSLVLCHPAPGDIVDRSPPSLRPLARTLRVFNLSWLHRTDTRRLRHKIRRSKIPQPEASPADAPTPSSPPGDAIKQVLKILGPLNISTVAKIGGATENPSRICFYLTAGLLLL